MICSLSHTYAIRRPNFKFNFKSTKMAPAQTEPYVETITDENGVTSVVINEHAYINDKNLSQMTFKFDPPADITDSIAKSTKERTGGGFSGKSGRIAYSAATCTYPDSSHSSKVALTGCIVDYRPKANDDYGRKYLCVAVPESYCDKMVIDGRSGSSVTIRVPPKAQGKNGYYWMTVNLDKLGAGSTNFVYKDKDGVHKHSKVNIREFMGGIESKVVITMICSVSASHTTDSIETIPHLSSATYNLGLKPYEIYIDGISTVEGPTFEFEAKKLETVSLTEQLVASDELAALAMSRLNLGN